MSLLSSPIQQRLDADFPIATEVPAETHRFSPSTIHPSTAFQFPGVTHESTNVVRGLMEENDRRFHIYQKISFQHNHLPHHLLTAYSLGATPKHLQAIFEDNVDDMAPIDRDAASTKKGVAIDSSNWDSSELLGKKNNYAAYLAFFHSEIEKIGGKACFEKYLFSSQANTQGKGNDRGPRMFYRFMAGVFHPFIHTGFGIEFKDQVMLAEGFAQAAVHSPDLVAPLFPSGWPNTGKPTSTQKDDSGGLAQPVTAATEAIKNAVSELSVSSTASPPTTGERGRARALNHPGLLELYAELCANEKLRPGVYDPNLTIDKRMRDAIFGERAGEVQRIAEKWAVREEELVAEEMVREGGDGVLVSGWGRRVEELQVFATLLAAATGREGRETKVDFFLMHCLTSSIFLPSYMHYLQPAHRAVLLQSYLLVVFHTALSRGRPLIRPQVLLQFTVNPSPPSRAGEDRSGKRDVDVDVTGDPRDGRYGNPWLQVVDNCLYSKDSHVMKSIRSLLLYSMKYGHLPPGHLLGVQKFGSQEESIPGIRALGGDIFIRAAGAVMDVMGWARERKPGEKEGWWDTSALGWDDAWK